MGSSHCLGYTGVDPDVDLPEKSHLTQLANISQRYVEAAVCFQAHIRDMHKFADGTPREMYTTHYTNTVGLQGNQLQ